MSESLKTEKSPINKLTKKTIENQHSNIKKYSKKKNLNNDEKYYSNNAFGNSGSNITN
jgi:hypothetical protein